MQGDVQAIVGAQGDGRLRHADLRERRAVVQVFLAVPLIGRNPPGRRRPCDRELGQLLHDLRFRELRLLRHVVAEADAVVEDPEHHRKAAAIAILLDELGAQFVVAVAYETALAPRLFPGLVEAARRLRFHLQVPQQLTVVAQDEAEPRIADHRLAIVQYAVSQAAFAIEVELDDDAAIGRCGVRDLFRMREAGQGQRQQDSEFQGFHRVSFFVSTTNTTAVRPGTVNVPSFAA